MRRANQGSSKGMLVILGVIIGCVITYTAGYANGKAAGIKLREYRIGESK